MDGTRYLTFEADYDGDRWIGEAESLQAAAEEEECNVVMVIPPGAEAYILRLEASEEEPLEGQGKRRFYAWMRGEEVVVPKVRHEDSYRFGKPVPDGQVLRFNGVERVIMPIEESMRYEQAEKQALVGVPVGAEYTIAYPNGVIYTSRHMIASGTFSFGWR